MNTKQSFYMRDPDVIPITRKDEILFVTANGAEVVSMSGPEQPSFSHAIFELMEFLVWPRAPQEIRECCHSLVGRDADTIHDFVIELTNRGILLTDSEQNLGAILKSLFVDNVGYYCKPRPNPYGSIIVGMTGSICSGLMAPSILSLCYNRFASHLDLVFTQASKTFANPLLFEHYGIRTWSDPYEIKDGIHVPHIDLGKRADCVLVMPASATTISRLVQGACTDLISLIASATYAPVVVAPVMNPAMLRHAPIAQNILRLQELGFYVMHNTLFFEASELKDQSEPVYLVPASWWQGAKGIMSSIDAVVEHHRRRNSSGQSVVSTDH